MVLTCTWQVKMLLTVEYCCFPSPSRPSQPKFPKDKFIIISIRLPILLCFLLQKYVRGELMFLPCNLVWLQAICSSKKQCVARVKLCKIIVRHLLTLSRNRWKPVPYLFVNLTELIIQSSFKMPWNLRQIQPLEENKTKQNKPWPIFLSWAPCMAGAVLKPCTFILSFNPPNNTIWCFLLFHIAGTYPESRSTGVQGRGLESALFYPQTMVPLLATPACLLKNSGLNVNLKE